ncbi:MAG: diguanylate cyclase [Candidatus Competibacter sp.]|nr:diguanylate cyclase [Candidatus Competibacter sp.]MDG4604916.1 diguanylate cyclase [Candidatus Contendobacter sp.]HRD50878.1 diguanylate cyclase [Candidatus Contendobacter sp.]
MKSDESGFILASADRSVPGQDAAPPDNAAATKPPSLAPASGRWRRILTLVIGYLLLYFGSFRAASLLEDQGGLIATLWYPPAGLTVFGMLAFGWAGVALDAVGNFLTLLLATKQGTPLLADHALSSLISALLHSAGYAAAILPLRHWVASAGLPLAQPAQIGLFLIAAVLGAMLETSISLARITLEAGINLARFNGLESGVFSPMQSVAMTWLVGDFIGIITLTPLLLVLLLPSLDDYLHPGRRNEAGWEAANVPGRMHPQILADTLILMMALLGIFSIPWSLGLSRHFPFATLLLLVPLAWITLRNGLSGAVLGTMVLSSGMVLLIALFGDSNYALEHQLVMIAIALTGLLLGSAVETRNQAQAALRVYTAQLEQQVAARTEALQLACQDMAFREHHQRALINAAPVGIAEFDAHGYCRYLNPIGCALTACDQEKAQGRHIFEFIHPDDRDHIEFIWHINSSYEEVRWLEFRLQGTNCWVSAHWINLFKAGQPFVGSIIIFVDDTERRRKDQQLWAKAHYDTLTGLPNRNLFWERLAQNLHRARRNRQNAAVLWIDLDGFKAVNDTLGHAAGDEVLQQVAHRLNGRMRDSDTIARMGGDEFAVILPGVGEIGAAEQVTADLTVLLAEPFILKCGVGHISASIGIAMYPLHTENAETLVKYADTAMYAAKNAGKNQVAVWQPDI